MHLFPGLYKERERERGREKEKERERGREKEEREREKQRKREKERERKRKRKRERKTEREKKREREKERERELTDPDQLDVLVARHKCANVFLPSYSNRYCWRANCPMARETVVIKRDKPVHSNKTGVGRGDYDPDWLCCHKDPWGRNATAPEGTDTRREREREREREKERVDEV
jgi:hypothetical protein